MELGTIEHNVSSIQNDIATIFNNHYQYFNINTKEMQPLLYVHVFHFIVLDTV